MAYDPCSPDPVLVMHRRLRAPHHHHPIHIVVGRRVPPAHAMPRIADACPKTQKMLWLPRRVKLVALHLADPPLLTVLGITVVGVSAFPGVTMVQSMTGPAAGGPSPPPAGGTGPGTSVPEPGTAAILAVAMVVVLVSSWMHGRRAFRTRPESKIVAAPFRVQGRKEGVLFEKRTKNFWDLAPSSRERRT